MNEYFWARRSNIDAHFKKNFNTQGVFKEIDELMKMTNKYMAAEAPKHPIIKAI